MDPLAPQQSPLESANPAEASKTGNQTGAAEEALSKAAAASEAFSGTPARNSPVSGLNAETTSEAGETSSHRSGEAQEEQVDTFKLREQIIQMLHTVYDPEIPVDIWELGLVYRLDVRENGDVYIQMTLTSPMCPVAGSLPPEVRQKVSSVPGVRNVEVELTWDPPWHMGMMSDVARLKLGFM